MKFSHPSSGKGAKDFSAKSKLTSGGFSSHAGVSTEQATMSREGRRDIIGGSRVMSRHRISASNRPMSKGSR